MANIYKGFSTVGKVRAPYTLIDGELIKQDLMNELKARDVFEHKEYYSRLKSSIRKIQKDEIVENYLMDEINKKV